MPSVESVESCGRRLSLSLQYVVMLLLTVALIGCAAHADLRLDVEKAVRSTALGPATYGISVRDADSGAELVDMNGSQPLIPASNMKLLTTGVALHILGGEFAFRTRLLRDGNRLIVLADGDPAFADPELLELTQVGEHVGIDVEQFLALWTEPVKDAGFTQIDELLIDDRVFDREFIHPTWPADQLNRRYCAEVAGLNFHLNILHFFPKPIPGSRPNISHFVPRASWLDLSNSGTSKTGTDDSNTAWIARAAGSNRMRFHGNVKFEYRAPVPVTVHNMPEFFGRMFMDRLKSLGVEVHSFRLIDRDEPRTEGEPIAPIVSTSIATAITRCNRDSNNLYAEALLKRCGAEVTKQPGSWINGAAVARHAIHERLGSPNLAKSIVIADGSGLSRDNRVAPATLTAWLNTFHNDSALGPLYLASLAEPGQPGTLRNRFRNEDLAGARIHAKSGYINGVSSLSGFVTGADGRRRSFSVIVNDIPDAATLRQARALQERIVKIIAEDLAQAPVQLGSD